MLDAERLQQLGIIGIPRDVDSSGAKEFYFKVLAGTMPPLPAARPRQRQVPALADARAWSLLRRPPRPAAWAMPAMPATPRAAAAGTPPAAPALTATETPTPATRRVTAASLRRHRRRPHRCPCRQRTQQQHQRLPPFGEGIRGNIEPNAIVCQFVFKVVPWVFLPV